MAEEMKWRIYYDDETVYTSEDGKWEDAPLDGVLFVVQLLPGDLASILTGNDYYIMVGDTIAETGDIGPILRKLKWIKFGRSTTIRTLEKMRELAVSDMKKMQIERRKA